MEGLIKGILDVALGHEPIQQQEEEEERKEYYQGSAEITDRATWAQVVVSGDDGKEEGQQPSHYVNNTQKYNNYNVNSEKWQYNTQQHQGGVKKAQTHYFNSQENHGDWGSGGSQQGIKAQQYHSHEEQKSSNEAWKPHEHNFKAEYICDNESKTVDHHRKNSPSHLTKLRTEHWNRFKRAPTEQEYATKVDQGVNIVPTNEEMSDLSKACTRLWELDFNRLVPGRDYEIDVGGGKKPYDKDDRARGPLFVSLGSDVLYRPTYSRFCALLDNYNPEENCSETVTSQDMQEQVAFIEEITRSAPFKFLHKYLLLKRLVPENYDDFKRMMRHLWFDLYSRGGTRNSSSAFEHVFVGEIKNHGEQEISGFHNWIQFYLEEVKGKVNHQGYILPRGHGQIPDGESQLLTVQFEWNHVKKSMSSMLVGVSPEFEIALYTLCFFAGEEDNHVCLGPYHVNIKCYKLGHDKIGSVFPISKN